MAAFHSLLGLDVKPEDLTFFQMSLRGVVVFLATLVMIRIGDRRALAKKSAFDFILALILASTLSRAINGTSPFFATLGVGFVLVLLHRLLARLAFHSHRFGNLIKGRDDVLISDGVPQRKGMAANDITEHDLLEDLRLNANIDDLKKVASARLERSGDISVVLREKVE